jgi:serine/threonine protein kinase
MMISGIEYLHNLNIAHLDIKPSNIFLGNDFELKIGDFDLAYKLGDKLLGKGTKRYMAPELENGFCKSPFAADIFSAGVVLLEFKAKGREKELGGKTPKGSLCEGFSGRWDEERSLRFEGDFMELVRGMTKDTPEDRWSLEKVKGSPWYKKEVYSKEEFKEMVLKYLFA